MGAVSEEEALAAGAKPMVYFSHDANAAQDLKCRRLIRKHGVEGYGRWWLLCEALAAADGHRLPFVSSDDAEVVADIIMCDPEEVGGFVSSLAGCGLIDADMLEGGVIVSDRMIRNSIEVGRKRVGGMRGRGPRKKRE